MQVSQGLFAHMVVQRNKSNQSRAPFAGTCAGNGVIQLRVRANGKTLSGWNWKKVGTANGRKFAGTISGLKVGGPYDLDLRLVNKGTVLAETSVADILVGDVWVLAGQSNMEGVGWLTNKLAPVKQVRAFYMNDEWDIACDPLHTLWCAVDAVHGGSPQAPRAQARRHAGVGPGVAFGQEMYKKTGVPQGLLACGHGGTSMKQWDPALKGLGGKSLYGAMIRRFVKNGAGVAGIFWYQGCSDADADNAAVFTPRMKKLVGSMRRDFGNPRLPFVNVQISRVTRRGLGDWWDSIREQQRRLPEHIANLATIPAIDLPLDDAIHLSGPGQHVLGRRAAEAMLFLRDGRKAGRPPIELRDIRIKPNAVTNQADVYVRFRNVAGSLHAAGRPAGFEVDSSVSENLHHRIDLVGDTAILHLSDTPENASGSLYYGRGLDPYCNITDEAGRSLPAFGPLPLSQGATRAVTRFINHVRVSRVLPPEDIRSLDCPKGVKLQARQFPSAFCDRHNDAGMSQPALVYYAFNYRCPTAMKLQLLLGYDGPVKVWCDGKAIYRDPKGTNPAHVDDATVTVAGKKGHHEVIVALGSGGAAWGVFLRLERLDVSKAKLRRDPNSVTMPEVLG